MKPGGRMFLFLAETCALRPSWTGDLEFPGTTVGKCVPALMVPSSCSHGVWALSPPDMGDLFCSSWQREEAEGGGRPFAVG